LGESLSVGFFRGSYGGTGSCQFGIRVADTLWHGVKFAAERCDRLVKPLQFEKSRDGMMHAA
jgi:hypothetical protein